MGMELKDIFISVMIVGFVMGAVFLIYNDVGNTFGLEVDSSYNESYNKIGEIVSESKLGGDAMVPEGSGEEFKKSEIETDIFTFMVTGTWTVMKMTYVGVETFISDMMWDATTRYRIPRWFTQGIMAMILLTVLFLIISAVVRFRVR